MDGTWLVAAREALTQAGWSPASAAEQERTATVIATGIGGFGQVGQKRGDSERREATRPAFIGGMYRIGDLAEAA
jgi:3-oxoacyl-[acyl-carrier-protein] synthase II